MRLLAGVFRFVPHRALLPRLAQGWRYAADLGEIHGEWSTLLWWCCGDCGAPQDAPRPGDPVGGEFCP